jgi:hypothetical protein
MTPSSRVFRALASLFLVQNDFSLYRFQGSPLSCFSVFAVLATTLMIIAPPPRTVNPFFASFLSFNKPTSSKSKSFGFSEHSPFFDFEPYGKRSIFTLIPAAQKSCASAFFTRLSSSPDVFFLPSAHLLALN